MADPSFERPSDIECLRIIAEAALGPAPGLGAAVSGSNAARFAKIFNPQLKEDVLFSTLFAQRAANGKVPDKEKDPIGWYNEYGRVLSVLGYNITSFSWIEFSNASSEHSVDRIVLKIARAMFPPDELEQFEGMIAALQQPANAGNLKIIDRNSISNKFAAFQVGVVNEINNNAVLKLSVFRLAVDRRLTTVLFYKFQDESVSFHYSNQELILNNAHYAKIREEVKRKLGDSAVTEIAAISLG